MAKRITVPLHLLDEPEIAMRTDIPDDYLQDLADDIRAQGLINPISVKRKGDRYIIGAGHCRFLAHKLLNLPTIEANDFTDDDVDLESIKISENLCRSDVSDAEIALYLSELQEKYHHPIAKLMELTRKSENWINTRLQLFAGDKDVFAALSAGQIKLGHAVALNRFPDNFRAQYLQACINSTPPISVIQNWLVDFKKLNVENLPQPDAPAPAPGDAPAPGLQVEACWFCGGSHMPWTMIFPRIHDHCKQAIEKSVKEAGG